MVPLGEAQGGREKKFFRCWFPFSAAFYEVFPLSPMLVAQRFWASFFFINSWQNKFPPRDCHTENFSQLPIESTKLWAQIAARLILWTYKGSNFPLRCGVNFQSFWSEQSFRTVFQVEALVSTENEVMLVQREFKLCILLKSSFFHLHILMTYLRGD